MINKIQAYFKIVVQRRLMSGQLFDNFIIIILTKFTVIANDGIVLTLCIAILTHILILHDVY